MHGVTVTDGEQRSFSVAVFLHLLKATLQQFILKQLHFYSFKHTIHMAQQAERYVLLYNIKHIFVLPIYVEFVCTISPETIVKAEGSLELFLFFCMITA